MSFSGRPRRERIRRQSGSSQARSPHLKPVVRSGFVERPRLAAVRIWKLVSGGPCLQTSAAQKFVNRDYFVTQIRTILAAALGDFQRDD